MGTKALSTTRSDDLASSTARTASAPNEALQLTVICMSRSTRGLLLLLLLEDEDENEDEDEDGSMLVHSIATPCGSN